MQPCLHISIHAIEKTGFDSEIQIQPGYEHCEHFWDTFRAAVIGVLKA